MALYPTSTRYAEPFDQMFDTFFCNAGRTAFLSISQGMALLQGGVPVAVRAGKQVEFLNGANATEEWGIRRRLMGPFLGPGAVLTTLIPLIVQATETASAAGPRRGAAPGARRRPRVAGARARR